VVFPFELIQVHAKKLAGLAGMNPVAQIITDLRHVLIQPDKIASMASLIGPLAYVPIGISIAVFILGFTVFHKLTPKFAESL
jgi:ABC-type polysaccharide/polyol phosphate export permease